jgi:hypothetical protein
MHFYVGEILFLKKADVTIGVTSPRSVDTWARRIEAHAALLL